MKFGRSNIQPYERQVLPTADISAVQSLPDEKSTVRPQVGINPMYAAFGDSLDVLFDISQRAQAIEAAEERNLADVELSKRMHQAMIDLMSDPQYKNYSSRELTAKWLPVSEQIRDDIAGSMSSNKSTNFILASWQSMNNTQMANLTKDGLANTFNRQTKYRANMLRVYQNDIINGVDNQLSTFAKVKSLYDEQILFGVIGPDEAEIEMSAWQSDTMSLYYHKQIYEGVESGTAGFENNYKQLKEAITADEDLDGPDKRALLNNLEVARNKGNTKEEEYLTAKIEAMLTRMAQEGESKADVFIEEEIQTKRGDEYFKDVYLIRKEAALYSFETRVDAEAVYQTQESIKDSIESVKKYGVEKPGVRDEIRENMPKKNVSKILAKYEDDISIANMIYTVNSTIRNNSMHADIEYLKSIKPDPEKDFSQLKDKQALYEMAEKTVVKKHRELLSDPVGWIRKVEATELPMQDGIIPLQPTAEIVSVISEIKTPEEMASYINASKQDQTYYGVPKVFQRILSKSEADSMVSNLMSQSLEDQIGIIRSMNILFGDNAKELFTELSSNKGNKLPAHFYFASTVKDTILQTRIMRAGNISNVDLQKSVVDSGQYWSDVKKDVDDSIDGELSKYIQTAEAENHVEGNIEYLVEQMDIIRKIAISEMVAKGSFNIQNDIVKDIAEQLYGGYAYKLPGWWWSDDDTYRYPKDKEADINSGKKKIMNMVKQKGSLAKPFENIKNIDSSDWYWTNDGDDAIILKTSHGIPVLDKDGDYCTVPFK